MKGKFGLRQLILLTLAYLILYGIRLAIRHCTGIHWFSPSDFKELLSLIALGLLWVWYFVDKFRKK